MRNSALAIFTIFGAMTLVASPSQAAPLSGGASGGGAIQGGSGAPGSGVGIPGAIVANMTAQGIGEDSTRNSASARRDYVALAPAGWMAAPAHVHTKRAAAR